MYYLKKAKRNSIFTLFYSGEKRSKISFTWLYHPSRLKPFGVMDSKRGNEDYNICNKAIEKEFEEDGINIKTSQHANIYLKSLVVTPFHFIFAI